MNSLSRWQLFALSSRKRRCSSVTGPASPDEQQAAVAADHRHAACAARGSRPTAALRAPRARRAAPRAATPARDSRGAAPGSRAAARVRARAAASRLRCARHRVPGARSGHASWQVTRRSPPLGRRRLHSSGRVRPRSGSPWPASANRSSKRAPLRAAASARPASSANTGFAQRSRPSCTRAIPSGSAWASCARLSSHALAGASRSAAWPIAPSARSNQPQPETRRSRRSAWIPVTHRRFRAPALTVIPF